MLRHIFHLSRPLYLLFAGLAYLLGVGMAHYLGAAFNGGAFSLGLLWVLVVQFAAYLLDAYFSLPFGPRAADETPRQRERLRSLLLQVASAALAVGSGLIILMIHTDVLDLLASLLIVFIFLLLLLFAIPPVWLSNSGFGELILASLLAAFIPALGFLLQMKVFHRILPLVTFPITFLALAYLLVCDFPSFASDQKYNRGTLLIRLTWPRAVLLHHGMILLAYLLLAIVPLLGLPLSLIWPAFLILPFSLVQIFWLRNISLGGRPMWNSLTAFSAAVFGLILYIITLTFFLR